MVEDMGDGEVETSDHFLLGRDESSSDFPSPNCAMDSFFDELQKNPATCTHTHMCNPPGPYAAVHTHTCYHTHTHVLASDEEGDPNSERLRPKVKRPSGNREAVRKYREKKKAHTAYLEEEVRKLRVVNQQLVTKLQVQATLEAEAMRLRNVLVDLGSKIDGEFSSFPIQKPRNSAMVSSTKVNCMLHPPGGTFKPQCQSDLPCFLPLASSSHGDAVVILGGGKAMFTPTTTEAPVDVMDSTFSTTPVRYAPVQFALNRKMEEHASANSKQLVIESCP